MKKLLTFFSLSVLLQGCTFSFIMNHTDRNGSASDLVDQDQTASPDISPNLDIPLK